MKNYLSEIKDRLNNETNYRYLLFRRGYILTKYDFKIMDGYPFYDIWDKAKIYDYYLYTHPDCEQHIGTQDGFSAVILGHAYNPLTGEIEEQDILNILLNRYINNQESFFDYLDELTGVFVVFIIHEEKVFAVQDCGGQKMLYFGEKDGVPIFTSSPQLACDLFNLMVSKNVITLLSSKGYYRGSGFLPGNLSPFDELKRLGSNTFLYYNKNFIIKRFFPRKARKELYSEEEKRVQIDSIVAIMRQNILLAKRKWPRLAISLTGGMDSKFTFACSKDLYNSIFCYSFVSKESERIDAIAASEICKKVGIQHHCYQIPINEDEIEDYDFLQKIIEHNTSYLCKLHPNEKRKYIYLERQNDFDTEIKSDMSEVARAYTTRKYWNVKMPQKLSPRHFTITQGRYFLEPKEIKIADEAFELFMKETGLIDNILGYSMHDLGYWEVRMSSWAATSFASQEFFHRITIPYNNRYLLNLFLQFPEKERIIDQPYWKAIEKANIELANREQKVKDSYFSMKRMLLETLYYYYATHMNTK